MYGLHITNMAQDLIKAGLIPESKLAETIEALSIEWKNRIAVTWCVEDVIAAAKEKGKVISLDLAMEALENMLSHHDAQCGITWDTILDTLEDDYFKEQMEVAAVKIAKKKVLPLMLHDIETHEGKKLLNKRLAEGV